MQWMRVVFVLSLVIAAAAGGEDRPVDRIYFAPYAGVSRLQLDAFSHELPTVRAQEDDVLRGPGWAGGFELGYWPTDWLGISAAGEVFELPFGRPRFDSCSPECPGEGELSYHGVGMRLGPAVRFALPLRYFAPYIGAGPAVSFLFLNGEQAGVPFAGAVGPVFGLRIFGGFSIYLTRDVRLFVDYHAMPLGLSAPLTAFDRDATMTDRREPDWAPAGAVTLKGLRSDYLVAGVAITPALFKKSPDPASWVLIPLVGLAAAAVIANGLANPQP
jgi:hypothetical protein